MRKGVFGVALFVTLAAVPGLRAADELPPLIPKPGPLTLVKPGQMTLSPDGDRIAITDRFGNRIYVISGRGELIWSVGEGVALEQPTAVMFRSSGELVFSQWESHLLFRVAEKSPTVIDTLVDSSLILSPKAKILKLYSVKNGSILALLSGPDMLVRTDQDFTKSAVLVKAGSGKGRLDRPVACAQLVSGQIAIAQEGAYPIQVFAGDGSFLFVSDWSSPTPRKNWEATAIAIDQRERIWVADATLGQFRQYDATGTLVSVRDIGSSNRRPADMVITGDNQLLVVDENGRLDMYDLSQEN